MSRIGRKPVPLPKGVTAQIDGQRVSVKGPKGEIGRTVHPELTVALEDNTIVVRRPSDESRHKALHGLTRTLIANMVDGVTKGFAKALEIQGVGKELVGQVAAELRAIRPPEPYKGKGIRYAGERVRRKAGKTAQAAK